MTEFLKNNPIALRHCLLYQFLQKKSVGLAFLELRGTVGLDVIKEVELQHCFDQFEQGKFDNNKEPVSDMRDVLRNDKYALRVCILYNSMEFNLYQYPIRSELVHNAAFSMYKRFCKAIGEDVMEYREFDFWFHRFVNGEYGLNFERDKKRIYELMDMPIDIMRIIVEYLNIGDRFSLERTSQSLCLFSQEQKIFHRKLTFETFRRSASIGFGECDVIEYNKRGDDCEIEFRHSNKVIGGVSYLKQALQDFKKMLENPKLSIDTLIVTTSREDPESLDVYIKDALKFTHLLHVRHITFHRQSFKTLLNILPHLKPGYLTTINIEIDLDESTCTELVEMNQWKQAKYLDMGFYRFIGPLRYLCHFKQFTVARDKLFIEDVREMKEILFDSPDFDRCTVFLKYLVDKFTIMQVFGEPIEGSIDTCHYPIPNSTDYFEIIVRNHVIKIERKKK